MSQLRLHSKPPESSQFRPYIVCVLCFTHARTFLSCSPQRSTPWIYIAPSRKLPRPKQSLIPTQCDSSHQNPDLCLDLLGSHFADDSVEHFLPAVQLDQPNPLQKLIGLLQMLTRFHLSKYKSMSSLLCKSTVILKESLRFQKQNATEHHSLDKTVC